MMDQERSIFKSRQMFEQIVEMIKQAAASGKPIDRAERDLWQDLRSLGNQLLQGYVDSQGLGDVGETIVHEGRTLKRLEPRERRYVSVFGEIKIVRTVYATREKQKHELIPLDARLNLPDSDFSYLLQEWDQAFCVQGSYQQSSKTVEQILGLGQSVRSLEHMTQHMAQEVMGFRESQSAPPPQEEGSILVITADGKGVPMRRTAEEKESEGGRERRKKGEKANKKRQACVGSVYSIDPFVRTADEVVKEVARHQQQDQRPTPCHKEMRAELSREIDGQEVNGKERIFEWFVEEVDKRNGDGSKPVVCVMDGERGLWNKLQTHLPWVIGILDLFHVLERVWAAAYCFHQEGSQEAQAFVTDRLERILQGEVGRVIGGLKQRKTKQKLTKAKEKQLEAVITYLENNRQFMNYDEYLEKGYPIGSGVAEGACRHLVKDRMELTGMRWTTQGAQAILDLRAIYLNGEWEAFHQYRIQHQQEQLYPYRDTILDQWPMAA